MIEEVISRELKLAFEAHSMVDQMPAFDDVPETLTFGAVFNTSVPKAITIDGLDEEFTFNIPGDFMIIIDAQAVRGATGVQSAWYMWFEIDTGAGFTNFDSRGTRESFNNTDTLECHPVTGKHLFLRVDKPGTKLRIRHQTDIASTLTGIEATAENIPGGVPTNVPSISINGWRLWA